MPVIRVRTPSFGSRETLSKEPDDTCFFSVLLRYQEKVGGQSRHPPLGNPTQKKGVSIRSIDIVTRMVAPVQIYKTDFEYIFVSKVFLRHALQNGRTQYLQFLVKVMM